MNRRAFTLIEVLVAMVIVALLSATGMFAYKMAISQISRQNGVTFHDAMVYGRLQNLFHGTYFYTIQKSKEFTDDFDVLYLFEASPRRILFVSDMPLYGDRLALVELFLKEGKLLYRQSPVYDDRQNYKNPAIFDDAPTVTLLENLENPRFVFKKYYDLPKDYTSKIPGLVELLYRRDGMDRAMIFSPRYEVYTLKSFLKSRKAIF